MTLSTSSGRNEGVALGSLRPSLSSSLPSSNSATSMVCSWIYAMSTMPWTGAAASRFLRTAELDLRWGG